MLCLASSVNGEALWSSRFPSCCHRGNDMAALTALCDGDGSNEQSPLTRLTSYRPHQQCWMRIPYQSLMTPIAPARFPTVFSPSPAMRKDTKKTGLTLQSDINCPPGKCLSGRPSPAVASRIQRHRSQPDGRLPGSTDRGVLYHDEKNAYRRSPGRGNPGCLN